MKTNTIFYTLLIALISICLFSCDANDEMTNVEESIGFEEESNFEDVVFKADIDEDDPVEVLPDTTTLKILNEKYDSGSIGNEIVKILYRSEIDGEDLIDSTGLTTSEKSTCLDSKENNIVKMQGRSEIDEELIPDTTGLN
ncbi:hypothetical protein [Marinifilum flexuosum]|uniref:hypothetical protein n=1 Tax=Marinifilum flexuosum TaxID=1117708 RepID=UPI0024947F25|nr:hypothetical protein [Marinifilum flexuosum]